MTTDRELPFNDFMGVSGANLDSRRRIAMAFDKKYRRHEDLASQWLTVGKALALFQDGLFLFSFLTRRSISK